MKKLIALLLVAGLLVIAGCQPGGTTSATKTTASSTGSATGTTQK